MKDGQSFVLAGLLTSEEQESLSKIPYLGDIPVLGALFSKSETERRKTELIIVATVNLVDPVKETDIKLPKFKRTSDLERLLKLDLSDVDDEELENTIKAGASTNEGKPIVGGFCFIVGLCRIGNAKQNNRRHYCGNLRVSGHK